MLKRFRFCSILDFWNRDTQPVFALPTLAFPTKWCLSLRQSQSMTHFTPVDVLQLFLYHISLSCHQLLSSSWRLQQELQTHLSRGLNWEIPSSLDGGQIPCIRKLWFSHTDKCAQLLYQPCHSCHSLVLLLF